MADRTEPRREGVLVDAVCPGHCRTDMGGEHAPRSADEGAQTIIWLAGEVERMKAEKDEGLDT